MHRAGEQDDLRRVIASRVRAARQEARVRRRSSVGKTIAGAWRVASLVRIAASAVAASQERSCRFERSGAEPRDRETASCKN